MYRQLELLPQLFSKYCDLLRLRSFLAAETQGIAEDDFPDVIVANHAREKGEIGALVFPLQCSDALGGDAKRIGDRQSHAARAIVNGENAAGLVHAAIVI